MTIACLVLVLVLTLPISAAKAATSAKATEPELIPTEVCVCSSTSTAVTSSSSELRGHGPPSPISQAEYDEQLGITFGQSYTSLEYNVTAVEQTDPTLGTGPAYLLDGLANNGFWYQVGVSYDWGPGQTPGTGFDMNYEVFDSSGVSVYPAQGGGLQAFSGTVNAGDTITLNLYFSSGQVIMIAEDLNTGAYGEQTFSADGASYFVGLPNEIANSNGFFTGLMTEWYHGAPYYANLDDVAYSTTTPVGSGWMWMDEWNPSNDVAVFATNASTSSSFTSQPSTLQEFSYGSITEYADATEFVTGTLNSTSSGGTGTTGSTTGSTTGTGGETQVTMTFSYSIAGGGTVNTAPILTYFSDGTQKSTALTTTPTSYELDNGSAWSVSSSIPVSSDERLITSDSVTGAADQGGVISIQYQNQYYVTITQNNADGGSVQPASGWYDSGQTLNVSASANAGWKFEGWNSDQAESATDNSSSASVQVTGPLAETAVFYPGLAVTAPASASVTFSVLNAGLGDDNQGTVQPGTTESIYVPPSSEVVLETIPTSFLYSSTWQIQGSGSSSTVAILILAPSSIAPVSSFDYTNLAIVVGSIALVLLAVAVALAMRRKPRTWTTEGQTTLPSPEEFGSPSPGEARDETGAPSGANVSPEVPRAFRSWRGPS